ncbi:MAG: hypothetical protein IJP82_00845 [Bacteroidaceae bacterium]|nr:hypothetical protein [Bacteroidaceae bacterium]
MNRLVSTNTFLYHSDVKGTPPSSGKYAAIIRRVLWGAMRGDRVFDTKMRGFCRYIKAHIATFCYILLLLLFFIGGGSSICVNAQTDVTGYETVTVTIPASSYNADEGGTGLGAPQMAKVKYNRQCALVITSDDMGTGEYLNNWALMNGYPLYGDWRLGNDGKVNWGICPRGEDALNAPYNTTYMGARSQDVNDYQPLTFTDDAGKEHRFTATSAIWPASYNDNNYAHMQGDEAQIMIRTGWSFAQHDVNNITGDTDEEKIASIALRFQPLSELWANNVTGIGLKIMVEPGGDKKYIDATAASDEMCWSIFQSADATHPAISNSVSTWTTSLPTTFSGKSNGSTTRTFPNADATKEQNFLTQTESAIAAGNTDPIFYGCHGMGTYPRQLVTDIATNATYKDKVWVTSADEYWEYYNIYHNVVIENVGWDGSNLTFDVKVPKYKKNQFRELTINIPGLTGGTTCTLTSSDGTVTTGSYAQTNDASKGYVVNFGMETKILTYIDELTTLYRNNPTNLFIKRDAQYLIDQLLPGATKTAKQAALDKDYGYSYLATANLQENGTTVATKTLSSGYYDEATNVKYYIPRYILEGTTLYKTSGNGAMTQSSNTISQPWYGNYLSVNIAGISEPYTYAKENENVVFYTEAEDISGHGGVVPDHTTNWNSFQGRVEALCSAGSGVRRDNNNFGTITTLEPGTYKVTIGVVASASNDGGYYSIRVGGTDAANEVGNYPGATKDQLTEYTTDEFTVKEDKTVTIYHSGTSNVALDYVFIQKTADFEPSDPTVTLSSNVSAAQVNSTVTLKATPVWNGKGALTSLKFQYKTTGGADSEFTDIATVTDPVSDTEYTQTFTPTDLSTYIFRAVLTDADATVVKTTDDGATAASAGAVAVSVVDDLPYDGDYTLHLIDNAGNEVFTQAVTHATVSGGNNDPLANLYRSPFVSSYLYFDSQAEAQANSGTPSFWNQEDIYVGYLVDATKMASTKKYAIYANDRYMHAVVRADESHTYNNLFCLYNQDKDLSNDNTNANTVLASTLPFIDNNYMWTLGDDPYNFYFQNVGTGRYASPTGNSNGGLVTSKPANSYCLLYWEGDTSNQDYFSVRYKGTNSATDYHVMYQSSDGGNWRVSNSSNNAYTEGSKIYIKELPELNVNVVNPTTHAVEYTMHGYYNSAATMPSFVPFFLKRTYTSNHTFYYDAACSKAITAGSTFDATKFDGSNIYMSYELDTKWNTENLFLTSTSTTQYWYAVCFGNSNYLNAGTSGDHSIGSAGSNATTSTTADNSHWALYGSPYALKLVNRDASNKGLFAGADMTLTGSDASKAKMYAESSAVATVWEMRDFNNSHVSETYRSLPAIMPQGSANGEAPYFFLYANSNSLNPTDNVNCRAYQYTYKASTTIAATLTLSALSNTTYVDEPVTLTATATPSAGQNVTYFAIEQETSTNTWEVVGTAYEGANVTGEAEKDGEGVVTVTYAFTPSSEGTFNFRAKAYANGDTESPLYTTDESQAGSVVTITATVRPFVVGSDNYTLILVDKSGNELFTESNVPKSRVEEPNSISGRNADPLNNSWRSPLVTRYYYYSTKADAQNNSGSNLFDWSSTDNTVYVGYEVSDAIDLNSSSFSSLNDLMNTRVARSATEATLVRNADSFGKMYLLKFKTSAAYHSEDGSDKVETAETPAGTTVYPYTNGDGPMYIYTDSRYQDQKDNGASTRTRWPWFLVSPTGDPYHVYITSWQNSHANSGTNYYSYLRTFYQSGVGIVTNNVTDDPRTVDGNSQQILPTEYMLLRADDSNGTYKLTTVAAIDNGTTTERRDVTSLEQYWRNNPTAQIQAGRSESNNGELTATEKTTLQNKGWHNYNAWVNAAGWTGGTGSANKSYANGEHWYQSIQLGNGSFDLVEANIDGVLVLLDNHGWEIMRQPIVEHDDPDYATVQAALKKYDSPMVKNYKFYSTRNVNHKVYGYHKFDIITNTGSKTPLAASTRVDADKTITSLADYPEVTSGGALTDLYVIYDVKDEYANSYIGAATEDGISASQFLVRQGSNYAKANGSTITTTTDVATADNWYLRPNFNIDAEMGYQYNNGTGNSEPSQSELESTYFNDENYGTYGRNGFDPYNLRIQNVGASTYFTTNASAATLSSGAWTGNGTTLSLTNATSTYGATGYDQTTLAITNATFMAVQDGNGNMRLMPRFDHSQVVQGFTALAEQADDQPAGNTTHAQTTLITTPITYHIIDNSGADVFDALTYTGAGFAVPKEYQSPMVEQYYYHSSLEDAQTNRTTSNVTTVAPNGEIFVSYKVSDDFNADKAYTIYGANSYMHACYRYGNDQDDSSKGKYLWWMQSQKVDRENGNAISLTTLPFLDNTYAWQVGETPDPYNVRFLNKGARRYLNQSTTGNDYRMEQLAIIETAGQIPATATPFCILYYGDDTDDCTLYNRTHNKYVYDNNGDWRANTSRTGDNRRLTITELPSISINVVNADNEVECTLEGYYKSGCTWSNSFTPFYLDRIYTSGHTFYYTLADATAGTNAISGTVNDATVTANGAVYVKYTLASNWGAAVDADDLTAKKTAQTIKVMPSPSNDKINWYALRTNNSKYVGASTTATPANLSEATSTNATTDAEADANKLAQWAFIGTPYNLKLVDRYHGMSNYLGISEEAANRSFAFIDDGTADITTWEVCTGYSNNVKLLIRPQRSLNGETPYLYIGWNGGAINMSLTMSTGGNQGLDLTWVKETDAKTLTFKLYDKDGTYMSPTVSDFTLTGVSAGDDIAAAFGHTDLQRRFCEYTFYSSYDAQTQTLSDPVTEAGSNAAETVYVKWDYTDYAPVFSTGSDVRDYQYYIMTVCASGSNYPYIIGVDDDGSGGYDFKIDQNIGSIREHKHQFALVGNPYSFKLYSRYADQYVGTPNQSGLQIGGGAADAVFDMQVPVSEMNITQFVARLKGTVRTVTCNPPHVWIAGANQGFLTLRDIIIPVHVFKEGMTEEANQMDYREYAMDLTSHLSTADRITDSQLTETGNAVGTAHDFRHAFCDYTFYRSYDWDTGDMDNLIPDEGLPYYGGKDQWKRQFFATYTVDHDGFDQIYLIKGSDGEGIYIGKNTESTHGYTLMGVNNKTDAKNDDTRSYRWQMIGDPYDLQIVNVGLGETRNSFPLAVKTVSDGTTVESEAAGTLALLTSEIPEDGNDTESYGQYSRWEIIAKSNGNYVFWNIDEGEALRYTKSLNRRYAAGNGGVVRMLASEVEMVLELPIERYAVSWHVMENDGSNNYSQVATAQVIVDENTTVVIEDMPASLKRHFCLYNNMYSNDACSVVYSGNSVTVTAATDVYVPYILDSGAPDFLSATPTSSTAEKYWYEIGYPEVAKYIYYDTTNGVSSQNAVSVSALRDFANYQYCRWALVGSPYSVKFYNKETGTYLTSNGETLTMGAEGTAFTLYDDYSGNLCAIYDAATGTYINASATLQTYNGAGGTAADFSNTYGVVKIAFVLHYSDNTLRKYDSDNDGVLDATAAGTTETIKVDSYQKLDKALDDVLPKAWKRSFCKYTYDWGTSSTESTPSGTTVTTVSQSMVDAYNSHKDAYLYVHVTYDYTTLAPFQWSSTTGNYTGKHWYYLVNNHRPNGILGKMVHRDSDPKLRISTDLVSDQLYLNNYEWCVIGDPYGFRMLNRYDPDHRFDEFISVTSDVDTSSGKCMFKQAASNSQHIFEMMPGLYSYNFWIHPVYSVSTIEEPTDGFDELSYMGQNYNGSAAILMTSTANALRANSAANFRLERRSDATLKEYLDYAGMVGSLDYDLVTNGTVEVGEETMDIADIKAKIDDGNATEAELQALHDLADNPTNIVQMAQGYYRLIPYTWEKNNGERRYVRGYLYENERTASSGMNRNMKVETLNEAMYDPASVLWFGSTTEGSYPRYYVHTQGLGLTGNGMNTGDGYKCRYEDIGAGIMQLKSQSEDDDRHYDYLSCAGTDETSINHCFDEQAGLYKTRFYMQPIGSADENLLPLKMQLYPALYTDEAVGQQTFYFGTLYVPYDVVIPDGNVYAYAGKLTKNDGKGTEKDWRLQCEKVIARSVGGQVYEKGKLFPAGTPVLVRAAVGAQSQEDSFKGYNYDRKDEKAFYISLTIPNDAPAELSAESTNIFQGKYLEQVLSGTEVTDVPASGESVYVFGQATEEDYTTIPDDPNRTLEDGESHPKLEAGFYINKNTTDGSTEYSNRNNLYVRHNKIYLFEKTVEGDYPNSDHYSGNSGGSARPRQFIPLWFGEADIEEQMPMFDRHAAEGVYDLQGRRVATSEQVADGTWRKVVKSGVYIINGKKVYVE